MPQSSVHRLDEGSSDDRHFEEHLNHSWQKLEIDAHDVKNISVSEVFKKKEEEHR